MKINKKYRQHKFTLGAVR